MVAGGYLSQNDYNSGLTGRQGIKEYDKMRKGDGTVRAALQAMFLPLLRAEWYVKPYSEDPKDIEIAQEIEHELFESMEMSFQEWLRQALLYLPYGRMLFEIVYRLRDDGTIGWEKWAPRLPDTVMKWELDNGERGIVQMLPVGGTVEIPMEKMMVFINEKEGDNWEGISVLRSAYKHWLMKDTMYRVEAVAIERQGVGIPYVIMPENVTEEEEAEAEEFLVNLRANEQAHYKAKGEGWQVEFMDMKASTRIDPKNAIEHHNTMILMNVLAQFLALGSEGKGGSYALSRNHGDLFKESLEAIGDYISDTASKYAVRKLVDLNHPGVAGYPKLEHGDLGNVDYASLSESLERLSKAGIFTPDGATERHLRNVMGLPDLEEGFEELMELNALLDEIEGVQQPPEEKEDEEVEESEEENDIEAAEGSNAKGETQKQVKKIQQELKSQAAEIRIALQRKKVKGEKIEKEEIERMKLDIMEKKAAAAKKVDKVEASEKSKEKMIQAYEQLEAAIADAKNTTS